MAVIVTLTGIGLLGTKYYIRHAHAVYHQAKAAEIVKAINAYKVDNGKFIEPFGSTGHDLPWPNNDLQGMLITSDVGLAQYFDQTFDDDKAVEYKYVVYYETYNAVPLGGFMQVKNTNENYTVYVEFGQQPSDLYHPATGYVAYMKGVWDPNTHSFSPRYQNYMCNLAYFSAPYCTYHDEPVD